MESIVRNIDAIDRKLSAKIHNANVGTWEYLIIPFGLAYNPTFIWVFIVATYMLTVEETIEGFDLEHIQKSLKIAYFNAALYAIVMGTLLSWTTWMKRFTKRLRPKLLEKVPRIYNLRGKELNFSMPSGDTSQASLWAFFMLFHLNNPFFLCGIILVAFARIFYMCHWILDTVAGAIVGFTFAYAAYLLRGLFYSLLSSLYIIIADFVILK